MLRFRTNTRTSQDSTGLPSSSSGSLVVGEEAAVLSLANIFPNASPSFLRWAVAHHTAILKPPLLTLDHVVDAVSEKISEYTTVMRRGASSGPQTDVALPRLADSLQWTV
jgi:hypothetical protein